jgi:hypothetical protein
VLLPSSIQILSLGTFNFKTLPQNLRPLQLRWGKDTVPLDAASLTTIFGLSLLVQQCLTGARLSTFPSPLEFHSRNLRHFTFSSPKTVGVNQILGPIVLACKHLETLSLNIPEAGVEVLALALDRCLTISIWIANQHTIWVASSMLAEVSRV